MFQSNQIYVVLYFSFYRDIEDEDELLYGDAGPQTDVISQTAYEFLNSQFRASSSW